MRTASVGPEYFPVVSRCAIIMINDNSSGDVRTSRRSVNSIGMPRFSSFLKPRPNPVRCARRRKVSRSPAGLFFVTIVPDDRHFTVRTQLWVTDGTTEGTQMVFQEPGNDLGYAIDNLTALGNRLLFTAPNGLDADGFSNDMELFAASMKCPRRLTGRGRATFLATVKAIPQSSVAPPSFPFIAMPGLSVSRWRPSSISCSAASQGRAGRQTMSS